jgi:hypothetical protein
MRSQQTAQAPRRLVMVIANETLEGEALHEAIHASTRDEESEVLVIAPALNSRVQHWASDEDDARFAAGARLARSLDRLAADDIDALGYVGDADPAQAITDGLVFFPADEIIIATHPEQRSNWLARGLVGRVRSQVDVPVIHVVVDEVEEPETLVLDAA